MSKSRNDSKITLDQDINEYNIYERGVLSPITSENLVDNPIAIKQLINNHNLKAKEAADLRNTVSMLEGQVSYLRTSPFIAIVSAIINISGTVITGIAINQLGVSPSPNYSGWILLFGIVLVITGSISTILYPYVKGWFNPKDSTTSTS